MMNSVNLESFTSLHEKCKYKWGLVLLFVFLFCSPPFVIELFPFMPGWKTLYIFIFPLLFLYALKNRFRLFDKKVKAIVFFWIVSWLIFSFIHFDSIYISRCLICAITLFVFSYIKSCGISYFCKYFVYLMLVFSILGTIAFILNRMGMLFPIFLYENADGRTGYCFGITCTNTFSLMGDFRYSGYFDEPGAMGLWGLVAIMLNRLMNYSKKSEFILIICLIFTLSIGYIISIIVYLLLFAIGSKQLKNLIPICTLLIGGYFLIANNEVLNNEIFGRMQYDKTEGTLSGNTRFDEQENAKEVFAENPFFGIGATNAMKLGQSGYSINSNIYSPVAKDGIVGMLVLYLPFFITVYKNRRNSTALKYLLVYSLSFFHRAITVTVFDLIMFLVFMEMVNTYCRVSVKKGVIKSTM